MPQIQHFILPLTTNQFHSAFEFFKLLLHMLRSSEQLSVGLGGVVAHQQQVFLLPRCNQEKRHFVQAHLSGLAMFVSLSWKGGVLFNTFLIVLNELGFC